MIFYLYGPDSFRRNKKLKNIITRYKDKYLERSDTIEVDLEEDPEDWERVRDFLSQPSMFVDSKMAIIKGLTQVDKTEWVKTLKNHVDSEEKIFILGSDKKKPTKKFNFLLKKPVEFQEFQELGSRELTLLVDKLSKKFKIKFDKRAKNIFISFIISGENRAERVENELFKLSCLSLNNPLTTEDISKVIDWRVDDEMFKEVRNMLNAHNIFQRLALLEKLLTRDDSVDYVFNSAVYQIRGKDLLKFGNYDVMRKSGQIELEEALLDFTLKNI